VAKPGRLRDALYTLLKATSQPEIITQVDEGPAVLKMILEYNPGLVVFDSYLPDKEVSAMLGRIKAIQSQIRCIVLVNTIEQQQAAKSAGADAVLLKGFSTKNLLDTVEKFMAEQRI
jgi:DNA-binding NarL/FixJ family response regulator